MKVISMSDFNKRMSELSKEADEKVGGNIVPYEDLFEIAIKEQLLDAIKQGMKDAAEIVKSRGGLSVKTSCEHHASAILTAMENKKEI